jgi:hypothetical protein
VEGAVWAAGLTGSFLDTVSVKGAVWVGSEAADGMVWAGLLNCSFVGTVEFDVEGADSMDCDFLDIEVSFFLENNRFILRGIVGIVSKGKNS